MKSKNKSIDKDMHNFKKRVLEPAIKQINEKTDTTAEYEQYKRGRKFTGFSFKFKQKPIGRDPNTVDMFFKMSDSQINMFGNQLAQWSDLSHLASVGESYEDLAVRIKNRNGYIAIDDKRVALDGDYVEYPDGSIATILSGAGNTLLESNVPFGINQIKFDNGDIVEDIRITKQRVYNMTQ